jgi:hypothetical protein
MVSVALEEDWSFDLGDHFWEDACLNALQNRTQFGGLFDSVSISKRVSFLPAGNFSLRLCAFACLLIDQPAYLLVLPVRCGVF